MLPDDVLLEIFDLVIKDLSRYSYIIPSWENLAHVCRRWRPIILGSPQRLHLRIVCSSRTHTRTSLNIWPPFLIVIRCNPWDIIREGCEENIIAALEQHARISEIRFHVPGLVFPRFASAIQDPLPALTRLDLVSAAATAVLPETFLGCGSAPRLRSLSFNGISFSAIPKLLLCANDLVYLYLVAIPHSGYVSPEVMATCLSAMTRLESLRLEFESPRSRPERASRHSSPQTPAVLPVLTNFRFKGVSEYLEELVARIDAPQLDRVWIKFFNQLIFDLVQLPRFIGRAEMLKPFNQVNVMFHDDYVDVAVFPSQTSKAHDNSLHMIISCRESEWQLSSLTQICKSSLPPFSALESLYVRKNEYSPAWQDDMKDTQWLELLYPFAGVKNLYLGKDIALHVAFALQGFAEERVTEVLPALQNLFFQGYQSPGPIQEAIEQFVIARQLSGCPVAVHNWERKDGLEHLNWSGR